jgi:hypothetical protein
VTFAIEQTRNWDIMNIAPIDNGTVVKVEAKSIRQDQRNAEPGGKLKSYAAPGRRRPAANRIDEAFENADMNGFATLEEVRAYFRNRQGN